MVKYNQTKLGYRKYSVPAYGIFSERNMIMALMSLKDKEKYIGLQNFLLKSNEKKLMVSMEILMQTTALYIKNRKSSIAEDLSALKNTQKINIFFSRYDSAMRSMDELIAIEPYFDFLPPKPSEEKVKLEGMLEGLLNGLIKRSWEYVMSGAGYDPSVFVKTDSEDIYKKFFAAFEPYKDRLPQGNLDTLEELRNKILSDAEESLENGEHKGKEGFSAVI